MAIKLTDVRLNPTVAYHSLYVTPAEPHPEVDPDGPADALVEVDRGRALVIFTGIAMGPVALRLRVFDVEPPASETDDEGRRWEEAAEGNILITQPLYVFAPTVGADDMGPWVDVPAAGLYGFRVQCRGRGLEYDHTIKWIVESYDVTFWPQPAGSA